MEVHFESWPNKRDLPKLLTQQRAINGRIVVYLSVISFLFISRLSHRYVVVRAEENRSVRGLSHSMPTLFTGWWSPIGPVQTYYALAHNLLGGIDVTDSLHAPPLLGKKSKPAPTDDEKLFSQARFLLTLVFSGATGLLLLSWLIILMMSSPR